MNENHLRRQNGIHEQSIRIEDVEPVIHLSGTVDLDTRQLVTMIRTFARVHIAAPYDCPEVLQEKVSWHRYGQKETTAEVWNRVLKKTGSAKTLFLQDDETLDVANLASVLRQSPGNWATALVRWRENDAIRQCYQIRVVPSDADSPFDGLDLPDASRFFSKSSDEIAGKTLLLNRITDPFRLLDPEKELSARHAPAMLYLVTGIKKFDEGMYAHAAAHFRRVMKDQHALACDRIAALNGLAGCKAEQYKWARAVELSEESVRIQPVQQLGYLILFRVHQLSKRWKEAYEMLEKCYGVPLADSGASFDKGLPKKEMLSLLADMAFRAGMRTEAMRHYKSLHELLDEEASPELTERLLLFALEEQKYDLSVRYFCRLFGDPAVDVIEKGSELAAFTYLGHFIKNGWYDFPSVCCERMMKEHPENEAYLRRWIAVLSKSREIEKARALISSINKRQHPETIAV